jgi:uncharacterized damage-inducible protein DinB
MDRSTLHDAFGHHVWATLRLMDECASLTDEQLASPVQGTYGSILDMFRHIVGADAWYLVIITEGQAPQIDEDTMALGELRAAIAANEKRWFSLIEDGRDPGTEVVAHRKDGSTGHAPLSIRLAQVLHHGTDHRSQICTGLTALGIEPPEIDVWAYGELDGRVFDAE